MTAIASEVRSLLATAELRTSDGTRALLASDIFVLTRTTQEAVAAARALRTEGLPYAFYKQDGLFQTREAHDVRDLLAAIDDPHDRGRRVRAWLSPFFGISLDEAPRCLDLPGSHALLAMLFRFRALADDKRWARLFAAVLGETRLIEREVLLADSERELTNYLHIFEILFDEAVRARGTLGDLIHTITAFIERRRLPEGEDGNVQRLESDRAAVQLMTMHKAKGLEAPVVFLAGGLDRNPGFAHVFHAEGERRLHLGDAPPDAAAQERAEEDQRLAYVAITRAKSRLYLPFYGGRATPVLQRLTGAYGPIDRALERVIGEASVETLPERPARRRHDDEQATRSIRPASLALPWPPAAEPAAVNDLRERRGRTITSYSRLKEAQGGYHPAAERAAPDLFEFEDADRLTAPEVPPDQLPGGTASGRFIHEILEFADLDVVRRQAGWSFWAARPDVQELFERCRRRYDRRTEHLPHSYALAFAALTTPMRLGEVTLPEGIAGADRIIREMEFLYPIARDPSQASLTPGREGYVKGFIDVVLEHEGKVIILDWKTDLLPDYQSQLTTHVEANYGLQADLYTLALLRLMGITTAEDYDARFGGTAYCFVRGLDADGAGVYFTRPSWAEVQAAQVRLAETDFTGGRT